MNEPKSKFPTMGKSAATGAANASAEDVSKKVVKRKGAQAGDPTVQKVGHPTATKAKSGAAYGIRTKMPSWKDPQVGPVQGNGRLFTSVVNRTSPNFQAGIVDHD